MRLNRARPTSKFRLGIVILSAALLPLAAAPCVQTQDFVGSGSATDTARTPRSVEEDQRHKGRSHGRTLAARRPVCQHRRVTLTYEVLFDLCISNRHHGHKKEGSSEPVMNERMRCGRWVTCLVIRPRVAMRSSRVSGWPLASCVLKWAQTHSSGLSSGA